MNRIDRLSAILIQLQSKQIVKAQEIADRFNISLRTVYRDLKALEEAGVPLGAEAGVGKYLSEGYSLPPVAFQKEEAGALLMAAKLAEYQTDKSIKKHLQNALYKIRAALRVEEKAYLESLENSIEVLAPPQPQSTFPDHFLTDLQTALSQKRVVNFDYYGQNSDSFNNREVEPISLCFYARHWHLIAYCRLRQDMRDFRSDRIVKLTITSEQFDAQERQQYQGYLQSFMNTRNLSKVQVRFSKEAQKFVEGQKYYMGYVPPSDHEETDLMTFMTLDLDSFSHWLIQFADQVEIHYPLELKQITADLAQKVYQYYRK